MLPPTEFVSLITSDPTRVTLSDTSSCASVTTTKSSTARVKPLNAAQFELPDLWLLVPRVLTTIVMLGGPHLNHYVAHADRTVVLWVRLWNFGKLDTGRKITLSGFSTRDRLVDLNHTGFKHNDLNENVEPFITRPLLRRRLFSLNRTSTRTKPLAKEPICWVMMAIISSKQRRVAPKDNPSLAGRAVLVIVYGLDLVHVEVDSFPIRVHVEEDQAQVESP